MTRAFDEKVVMVTGAAGNLGAVALRAFHEGGARVVGLDRGADRLAQIFPEMVGSADCLLVTGVDMADEVSVGAAVEKTISRFGRLDVLVNTVGGFRGGAPLHASDPADWHAMFDINVSTTVNACRAAIPVMIRQKCGCIVNVGGIGAIHGEAGMAAYCASKAAVVRLTESLSGELRPLGIQVNCVLPAPLDTPQNRKSASPHAHANWVTLEDVSAVIVFLASAAARGVHSASIPILGKGP